jgi:hypothetical protein
MGVNVCMHCLKSESAPLGAESTVPKNLMTNDTLWTVHTASVH